MSRQTTVSVPQHMGRSQWTVGAAMVITFIAVAVYCGVRLIGESRVFNPPLALSKSLEPQRDGKFLFSPFSLLGMDWRVVEAEGRRVFSRPEFRLRLEDNGSGPLELVIENTESREQRTLILVSALSQPDLTPVLDESLRLDATISPEQWIRPLEAGDRIVRVENVAVESPDEIVPTRTEKTGTFNNYINWYTVERAGGDSYELMYLRLNWPPHWILFLAGVGFGVLGIIVFALKPYTRSAWGFLFFCWAFGIFWLLRAVPAPVRTIPEYFVFQICQALLPVPALVLLVTFSPLRLAFSRVRPVVLTGAALGLGLLAANQAILPGAAYLTLPVFSVWGFVMLGVLIWGMTMDLWLRLRGIYVGTAERLRGRVVRLACAAAFGPVLGFTMYYLWTDGGTPYQMYFELCVLLFPLIIGYAIVRHNLLHINEMLTQGAVFFSLVAVVGLVFAQGFTTLEALAGRIPALDSSWIKAGLAMGIFMAATQIQTFLKGRIRERFDSLDPELESFVQNLKWEKALSLKHAEFFDRMLRRMAEGTLTPFTSLDLHHPVGGWWLGGKTGLGLLGPTTQECAALFALMRTSPTEISTDAISDDLRLSGIRDQVSQAMKAVNASYVFPLATSRRLWGFLTLGDRENFRNRTPKELTTLREMVAKCAGFVEQEFVDTSTGGEHPLLSGVGPIAGKFPQCPDSIGPYRVLHPLGKGGMAVVFQGIDGKADVVAIKVANLSVLHDHELLQRFMNEGRLMLNTRHPNILPVIDVGREGEEPYLVMPFVRGGSLADRLKRDGSLTESLARRIAAGVARGLEHALGLGVYHRDIKPANIMMGEGDTPLVADFGLAKIADATQVTAFSNQKMGTPAYMSPELCAGEPHSWYGDQYALGVTLFEMLAGRRPFRADDAAGMLLQHIKAPVPNLREFCPAVTDGMVAIVNRLLAKDPHDRFPSYAELIQALESGDPGEAMTMLPGSLPRGGPGDTLPYPGEAETRLRERKSS